MPGSGPDGHHCRFCFAPLHRERRTDSVVDLLEQGSLDAVEAQINAFAAGARELRQPLYIWNAAVWHAMLALLHGQLTKAEDLAREALAAGAHAEAITASQYYAIQLLSIRQEQGRMAELERAAKDFVTAYPTVPAWRAALARLLWQTGQIEEARSELDLASLDLLNPSPLLRGGESTDPCHSTL